MIFQNDRIKQPKRESGFTIYLVLVILIIAGVILTITFYRSQIVQIEALTECKKFQARLLAESGINKAEYFLNGGDGNSLNWQTSSYSENVNNFGTIFLKNARFGVFSQTEAIGQRLGIAFSIKGMIGRKIPNLLYPVITLTGQIGDLNPEKGSIVNGTVVMTHGKVKNSDCHVINRRSPPFPFDSTAIKETVQFYKKLYIHLLSNKNPILGNTVLTSNTDPTSTKDTTVILGDCEINGATISSKFLVISGKVIIDQNAEIAKSIILCEKCIINKSKISKSLIFSQKKMVLAEGYHEAQFITNDTLQIMKLCRFGITTVLLNYRDMQNTGVSGGIYFEDQSRFKGLIFSAMDSITKFNEWKPSIVLGIHTNITGVIVSDNDIFIQDDTIKGHIYARLLKSSDNNLTYNNVIFNTVIQPAELTIPFPLFGPIPIDLIFLRDSYEYRKYNIPK